MSLDEKFSVAKHLKLQLNNKKAFSNLLNEVLHNVLFNYEIEAQKRRELEHGKRLFRVRYKCANGFPK